MKVDISRAFRNIMIDPRDAIKCGIRHKGQYYIDKALVFGAIMGTKIFQRISDAITYIMQQKNIHIWNYIDDIFLARDSTDATVVFKDLVDLVEELGLPINKSKLTPPTQKMVIMGIEIDVKDCTLAIPDNKITEIRDIIEEFSSKTHTCKRDYQSLLGKLLYISKIIGPARAFLNRMLNVQREHHDKKIIHLDNHFHNDLKWFRTFAKAFNGTMTFANQSKEVHFEAYVDASLQGIGAISDGEFYTKKINDNNITSHPIVVYEMLNIKVALQTWKHKWTNKRIKIHCDNMVVVDMCNTGKTKIQSLRAILREIQMIRALNNINLEVTHVYGVNNVYADALSRIHMRKNHECVQLWKKNDFIEKQVQEEWLAIYNNL